MITTTPITTDVALETPITRGETQIAAIAVRKPASGELRGLTIQGIQSGDINTMLTLLPRITMPALTAQDCEELDVVDMLALTGAVSGFFYSRAEMAVLAKVMGQVDPADQTPG